MAEGPIDERRFSEDEVREILRRAVESRPARRPPPTTVTRREGMSLAELRAIGREVGIDPARLEDAARAVTATGTPGIGARILGAPRTIDRERTVDGTVDPADYSDVLAAIRRVMGQKGEASEVYGALEWSVEGEIAERHVAVSSRDGRTTIRGSTNLTNAMLITYLPGGMVAGIVSLIGLIRYVRADSGIGLIVALVVLPVALAILRVVMANVAGSEAERLQDAVDEVARMAEQAAEPPEADG